VQSGFPPATRSNPQESITSSPVLAARRLYDLDLPSEAIVEAAGQRGGVAG